MSSIVPSLAQVFAALPDPRQARGLRHPLVSILLLSCVAMLAGARGQSGIADWARNYGEPWRTRLGFTHPKGPSQATLHRVFAHIAVEVLEAQLAQWTQQVCVALHAETAQEPGLVGIAMDGKTLRTSRRCGAGESHLVSLCRHQWGLVCGQVAVGDKANEITASDDLLALLMLTGVTVTGDAIFTQQAIAQTVLDAGNDYLLVVKGNQPTLHAEIVTLFADPDAVITSASETTAHSQRVAHRCLRASTELTGYSDWPGLVQVLCMERYVTHTQTGKRQYERAYAVTSLTPARATAAQLLTLWREHWHIESKLHYVRDVTHGADASTVRTATAPHALAALRNLARGLLRLEGATNIAAACRYYAAQPAHALAAVGLTWDNE